MKILILALCFCACTCDSSSSQESQTKTQPKTANAIPVPPKQEVYYHPQSTAQPQTQYVPVQFIPKQVYLPHQQPTMLIIAQPALVPQHMVYSNAAQQLLQYFHNNPQARYQLLHQYQQYQPHPTAQTYLSQSPSSTIGNYQYVQAPQGNYVHQFSASPQFAGASQQFPGASQQFAGASQQFAGGSQQFAGGSQQFAGSSPQFAGTPQQFAGATRQFAGASHQLGGAPQYSGGTTHQFAASTAAYPQYSTQYNPNQYTFGQYQTAAAHQGTTQYQSNVQPMQLSAISQQAHQTAQHFIKSAPPIITGFEQFTPEQQAQIKSQLTAHLGSGAPISPITSNHITSQPPTPPTRQQGVLQTTQQTEEEQPQFGARYSSLQLQQYSGQSQTAQATPQSQQGPHQVSQQVPQQVSQQQSVHLQPQPAYQQTLQNHQQNLVQKQEVGQQNQQEDQEEFSSSQEEKSDSNQSSSSNFTPSVAFRTHYIQG